VALGADFGLEIGEFFAEFELVLANVGVEEIGEGLVGAIEVFAELVGEGVAVGDGVEVVEREGIGFRVQGVGLWVGVFHVSSPVF